MTRYLTASEVLTVAQVVLGRPPGLRDVGLLESAVARPGASVFGEDAYPSLWEKATALLHSLAANHALVDGNKRTAWTSTLLFLELNGVDTGQEHEDAAEPLVLDVARGVTVDVDAIAVRLAGVLGRGAPGPG